MLAPRDSAATARHPDGGAAMDLEDYPLLNRPALMLTG